VGPAIPSYAAAFTATSQEPYTAVDATCPSPPAAIVPATAPVSGHALLLGRVVRRRPIHRIVRHLVGAPGVLDRLGRGGGVFSPCVFSVVFRLCRSTRGGGEGGDAPLEQLDWACVLSAHVWSRYYLSSASFMSFIVPASIPRLSIRAFYQRNCENRGVMKQLLDDSGITQMSMLRRYPMPYGPPVPLPGPAPRHAAQTEKYHRPACRGGWWWHDGTGTADPLRRAPAPPYEEPAPRAEPPSHSLNHTRPRQKRRDLKTKKKRAACQWGRWCRSRRPTSRASTSTVLHGNGGRNGLESRTKWRHWRQL